MSFITLTIACYLLLQASSSAVCSATPIPKRSSHAKQRSIAQQVHHVQVVDESVHNTMILLKKSMQKRKIQQKQQKQLQQRQQQRTKAEQKKKEVQLQKRMVEDSASTADMVSTNLGRDSSNVLEEEEEAAEKKRGSQSNVYQIKQHSLLPKSIKHIDITGAAIIKGRIKKGAKRLQGSRLVSAYETIVFSESQIPVFLSQDHHRQRFRLGAKSRSASKKSHLKMREHKQRAQQQFETTTKTHFETEENDAAIYRQLGVDVDSDLADSGLSQKDTQRRHQESGTSVGTSIERSNGMNDAAVAPKDQYLDNPDNDINSPVDSVINAQLHNKVLPESQGQNTIDRDHKEESQLQNVAHVALPHAGVGINVAEHSGQQVSGPATLNMRHDADFQQDLWYNSDSWCCSSSVLILFGLLIALLSYKLYAHKQRRSLSSGPGFSTVSTVESPSLKAPMTDAGRTTATRQ
ncbi:hypothetical protein BGZ51_001363 [Haplosporangium sp. Z 767]|nr:hypothetical protein BGZ50_002678 [Haplosporangium sp. Z 11]KAF9194019.1 hypothetical protein BGZ51_001363 [Haplosporangium sp. Z 767]